MLPEVINNTNIEKEQNESIKTIPRIIQEKKLTKNLIRFSFVNTHASLSSILHDVNHEIMERTNQDKSKSRLTRQSSFLCTSNIYSLLLSYYINIVFTYRFVYIFSSFIFFIRLYYIKKYKEKNVY